MCEECVSCWSGVCVNKKGVKFMRVWVACIIHAAQSRRLYFK